jgi:hypothetical protein
MDGGSTETSLNALSGKVIPAAPGGGRFKVVGSQSSRIFIVGSCAIAKSSTAPEMGARTPNMRIEVRLFGDSL